MSSPSANETWVIETGDAVIQKISGVGMQGLSPWETLVYSLWVADYGMRNAGDLDVSADIHPAFQQDARQIATDLMLPLTHAAFSLSKMDLERDYFNRFEAICDEIRESENHFSHR